MGILDDLKHKAEELGERAKEGLDAARDRAGDLVDDVRDRLGQGDEEGEHAPTRESDDVGPDSSSTDAVQPGYVTGEDDTSSSKNGDSSLTDDADAADDAEAEDSVVEQEGLAASFADDSDGGIETTETDAVDTVDPAGAEGVDGGAGTDQAADEPAATDEVSSEALASDVPGTVDPAGAEGVDRGGEQDASGDEGQDAGAAGDEEAPLEPVATDVDPYDEPLSESIGAELSDADREALAEAVGDASEQDSQP